MNHYEQLEIPVTATPDEIKAAYHRLAKYWHPDRFTGEEKRQAEEKIRVVVEAFNILKDPLKRADYDASLPKIQAAVSSPQQPMRPQSEMSGADWFEEAKKSLEKGDFDGALGKVIYSLRLEPDRPEAKFFYGKLLEIRGDNRNAVKAYEEGLRLDPKNIEATIRLGELLITLGMTARGQRLLDSARKLDPRHKKFALESNPGPKGGAKGKEDQKALSGLEKLRAQINQLGDLEEVKEKLGKLGDSIKERFSGKR